MLFLMKRTLGDWNIHQSTLMIISNKVEEEITTPKISEISTQAAIEISTSVLKGINAADQALHRVHRRPVWMMDYKVTKLILIKMFSNLQIVILQLLGMLSKRGNRGKLWMKRMMLFKEMTSGIIRSSGAAQNYWCQMGL